MPVGVVKVDSSPPLFPGPWGEGVDLEDGEFFALMLCAEVKDGKDIRIGSSQCLSWGTHARVTRRGRFTRDWSHPLQVGNVLPSG